MSKKLVCHIGEEGCNNSPEFLVNEILGTREELYDEENHDLNYCWNFGCCNEHLEDVFWRDGDDFVSLLTRISDGRKYISPIEALREVPQDSARIKISYPWDRKDLGQFNKYWEIRRFAYRYFGDWGGDSPDGLIEVSGGIRVLNLLKKDLDSSGLCSRTEITEGNI